MKRIHRLLLTMISFAIADAILNYTWGVPRVSGLHLGIMSAIATWALEDK